MKIRFCTIVKIKYIFETCLIEEIEKCKSTHTKGNVSR